MGGWRLHCLLLRLGLLAQCEHLLLQRLDLVWPEKRRGKYAEEDAGQFFILRMATHRFPVKHHRNRGRRRRSVPRRRGPCPHELPHGLAVAYHVVDGHADGNDAPAAAAPVAGWPRDLHGEQRGGKPARLHFRHEPLEGLRVVLVDAGEAGMSTPPAEQLSYSASMNMTPGETDAREHSMTTSSWEGR